LTTLAVWFVAQVFASLTQIEYGIPAEPVGEKFWLLEKFTGKAV
jgi:hypothetical protein